MNDDFPFPPPAPAPFNHPAGVAPRIERPVERANDELQSALVDLENVLGSLANQLDSVLTPTAPAVQVAGQPMPPKAPQCELVGGIERKTVMVRKLYERVNSVLNRLEL